MKPLIRDSNPGELARHILARGLPRWRADQLARWLFTDGALDWAEMTNLPATLRDELAADFDLAGLALRERQVSTDGTRKFLFGLRDGQVVESVIIPMEGHATFCISSQVGCAMACAFCATARGGLARNLTPGEILEQVIHLRADLAAAPLPELGDRGHNIVFMGMGEPLDNFDNVAASLDVLVDEAGFGMSPRRIQISTAGPAAGLARLSELPRPVGLTLSVNGCDPDLRRRLMPVPGRTPLAELLGHGERHARRIRRPVTVAFVLIDGVNDTPAEAKALAALVRGRPFKVNLIPLNAIDARWRPSPPERVAAFQRALDDAGVRAFVRISGGEDIDAACGQLRHRRK